MAIKTNFNRREFLKIVGATTGVAAAGCAPDVPEKLIPYVVQPDEVIPGVANWYTGSCSQCSAGCGVLVRTREGRALKVEGNPAHPINRGGLCALGQSTLQTLYDPDRIREPLKREINGSYSPISWVEAIKLVSEKLAVASSDNKKEAVILTNPLTGSVKKLIAELKGKIEVSHLEYELISKESVTRAAQTAFGTNIEPSYRFSKADVVVGFGADYLETWISPVEFARDWSSRRTPSSKQKVSYVVHFEPRLSLTAANADQWLMNSLGSEAAILASLLSIILEKKAAIGFSSTEVAGAERLLANFDVKAALSDTNVTKKQLEEVASRLINAETSLVVVGGVATAGEAGQTAQVLGMMLNAALGNVGKTLILNQSANSDANNYQKLMQLVDRVNSSEERNLGFLLLSGVNPAFTLPERSKFKEAISKSDFIVALATNLDETSRLAHVVLPLSTNFEAWADSEPQSGVYNLNQPSMQPLYASQSLGDTLIAIAGKLDVSFGGAGSFYDYMRANLKSNYSGLDFEKHWQELLQKGGDWAGGVKDGRLYRVDSSAFSALKLPANTNQNDAGISMLAFVTANAGDGSGANRAWLQEIPNTLTTAVWGSWVEVNPKLADKLSLKQGEVVQLITPNGSINAPVFVSKYVHPDVVAVPVGQGHSSIGRFGDGVGANPLSILSASKELPEFVINNVLIRKDLSRNELVITQMQNSELKRGIVRSVSLTKLTKKNDSHHKASHDEGSGHGGGHHDPYALGPQEAPKQMYKQMDPPLYRWGMSIDLSKCTGCSACVVACYAENNVPVVGKELCAEGREMSWLKIDRYFDGPDDRPVTGFMPMLCQHCGNAPCEPVCPVYATYHNEEGLNAMLYNRCVGTRYCGNNCSYKVRRFNWFKYDWQEPLNMQLNPDVTVREVGIMEKCSFCVQRIREAQGVAKDHGRPVRDGEVQPACSQSCPTQAIKFGNLLDKESAVFADSQNARAYKVLDSQINTQPAISYLAKIDNDSKGNA